MRIERAEYGYESDGKRPVLRLTIDGQAAAIGPEQKPTLIAAGYVYLGPDWDDRVPVVEFRAPGVASTWLRGFTRDPAVLTLFRRFRQALDAGYTPGPVPIA